MLRVLSDPNNRAGVGMYDKTDEVFPEHVTSSLSCLYYTSLPSELNIATPLTVNGYGAIYNNK